MTELQLRPYQAGAIDDARKCIGDGGVMINAPTGAGKSAMAADIIKRVVDKGKRAIFICPNRNLVRQTWREFGKWGVAERVMSICMAGKPFDETAPIAIGTVQTIKRRAGKGILPHYDLVVIDEAHHSVCASYTDILKGLPGCMVLGLSATPCRNDREALRSVFKHLVRTKNTRQLIEEGFLAPYDMFTPDGLNRQSRLYGNKKDGFHITKKKIAMEKVEGHYRCGDAVKEYKNRLNGMPVLVFGYDIDDCEKIVAAFVAADISAQCVHSKMDEDEVERAMAAYASGAVKVLVACNLISEGYDVPATAGVFLMRKTDSIIVYLQQCGRALRPVEGKRAIIVDFVGNNLVFGKPCTDYIWNMDGQRKKQGQAPTKFCPECCLVNYAAARVCESCGHEFEFAGREEGDGEMVEARDVEDTDKALYEMLRMEEAKVRERPALVETVINNIIAATGRHLVPENWRILLTKARIVRPYMSQDEKELLRIWARRELLRKEKLESENDYVLFAKALDYKDGWIFHNLPEKLQAQNSARDT